MRTLRGLALPVPLVGREASNGEDVSWWSAPRTGKGRASGTSPGPIGWSRKAEGKGVSVCTVRLEIGARLTGLAR